MSSTPSTRRRLDGGGGGSRTARFGQHGRVLPRKDLVKAPDSLVVYAQVPATKRPPNPQGGAMFEAAARVLADPDAPRTREEAVEQVMAATQCLASGQGVEAAIELSGRRALARQKSRKEHPLKRKVKRKKPCTKPGRAAALRERVKALRRARRSSQ